MKNVLKDFKEYPLYFGMFFLTLGFTSCSDDDDGVIDEPENQTTGTITASDQTLSGNTLMVDQVTVGQDSWLIARNTGENEIVSDTAFVEQGTAENVEIALHNTATLEGDEDGDDFDVSLYADNPNEGVQGTYDAGIDEPVTDDMNVDVRETVTATAPSIFAEDNQMVTEQGDVTFSSVNTGSTGGYVGLYGQNDDGSINEDEMIGQSEFIQPGASEDITARFNQNYEFTEGDVVYPRLFTDNPDDQTFTYNTSDGTEDLPETYGYDATTGTDRFVGNSANTTTSGAFTVGNSGVGTGTGTGM